VSETDEKEDGKRAFPCFLFLFLLFIYSCVDPPQQSGSCGVGPSWEGAFTS
jgi:hypothetical protein